jgi:hypothetical protein
MRTTITAARAASLKTSSGGVQTAVTGGHFGKADRCQPPADSLELLTNATALPVSWLTAAAQRHGRTRVPALNSAVARQAINAQPLSNTSPPAWFPVGGTRSITWLKRC